MLKLDNTLLDELGLGGLPEDQKRSMLQHIYDTLELRVGTNLANQMTDQQLAEFEKFIDDGGDANQAQALQWLESNLPNYKQVVNDVFEALKVEIKQMAPQIMASAMSQPTMGPAPAQYQQPAPVQPMPAGSQAAPVAYQPPMPAAGSQPFQPQQSPAPMPAYQPQAPAPPAPPQPVPDPYAQPAPAPAPVQSPAGPLPTAPAPGGYQPPAQPQQDAQAYQFPSQQPPAGPGGYQAPPQYPGGQQAA